MEQETCFVVTGENGERCPRPAVTLGLCEAHHAQAQPWTRAAVVAPQEEREGCTVVIGEGGARCARPTVAGGMCEAHYQQARRYGTPLVGQPLRRQRRYTGPRGDTCRCCGNPDDGKGGHGLRHACYEAWRRAGSPDTWKGIEVFDPEVTRDREGDPVPARG